MAITIEQKPGAAVIPIGQSVIFSISDSTTLAAYVNVRFYADVYFSNSDTASATRITTLKTTPNASGSGIFDIRRVIESHLGADYNLDSANSNVQYKGQSGVDAPVHYVSKYSTSTNQSGVFYCKFYVKASTTYRLPISTIGATVTSDTFLVSNRTPSIDVKLKQSGVDYLYDLEDLGMLLKSSTSSLLTTMPAIINARIDDVGTVGFSNSFASFFSAYLGVNKLTYIFYNDSDTVLSTVDVNINTGSGAFAASSATTDSGKTTIYAGVYPGNIKQHLVIPATTSYYTFQARKTSNVEVSKVYTVNIIEECKYPVTRLCWLNEFGVWDYYNFNKKSESSTSSAKKFFNSSHGDWSGATYKSQYHSGGKKAYSVDSRGSITLNTDYITEESGIWLEGLITSSEVFLIKEGSTWELGDSAPTDSDYRHEIEPVVITNSSIVRKTSANQNLISHQFTIDKSNTNNTHRL